MFLPGPYMLWWPALRASHPLRTPEAEEPLSASDNLNRLFPKYQRCDYAGKYGHAASHYIYFSIIPSIANNRYKDGL